MHQTGRSGGLDAHDYAQFRAATAIEQAEHAEAADRTASVLVVTSDVPDLTRLVAGRAGVVVTHVGKLGRS